jgi:hypothetical protein
MRHSVSKLLGRIIKQVGEFAISHSAVLDSGQKTRKTGKTPPFFGGGFSACDTARVNSCGKAYKFNLPNFAIKPFVIS